MLRLRTLTLAAGLVGLTAVAAPADDRTTIKGQVVFPAGKDIPPRADINVTQDKPHCLMNGPLKTEDVVVNPANRGIQNVVVWLRPDDTNPKAPFPKDKIDAADASRKPAEIVIDQPCCMFTPRVSLARVGDTIVVKNSAPVPHNFFWVSSNNGEENKTVPASGAYKFPTPLVAETTPIGYKCTIHPWMSGWVRVYDHPYFAVTDKDGKFEIKNAPTGTFRLVVWHETKGNLGGKEGRLGKQIPLAGATTELPPIEFDVTP